MGLIQRMIRRDPRERTGLDGILDNDIVRQLEKMKRQGRAEQGLVEEGPAFLADLLAVRT